MARKTVVVVGAGPAGLMAAETLARSGLSVTVSDRMANPGRKFLLAGRGGLNLTHTDPLEAFLERYGPASQTLAPAISAFSPDALRAWCEGLGETTFVGTSGRVFPKSLKASPLLRAWLARLDELGVKLELGQLWTGFDMDGRAEFVSRDGSKRVAEAEAVLLALGGASWPRLGSDGSWVSIMEPLGLSVTPLSPANCGVQVAWSETFRDKFAGEPLKRIAVRLDSAAMRGEAIVSNRGLEGGVVYALIPPIRRALAERGACTIILDLRPDVALDKLAEDLSRPLRKQTLTNHLRKTAGLSPVAISLLRESHGASPPKEPAVLAKMIKNLPIAVTGLEPITRAISSAGGIALSEFDENFMLKRLPGVFVAGEMLDWEAPTGGYLLQACFSTGLAAAKGMLAYLE